METQEKQSYLRRLPDSAAAFINRVIKKMRYRKKVCSEVMAELEAHFEDELKDCTADEQRQQKAQQLITQFGEVTLLAVLLRRAKKRCRPLWRTVVARTFQAVGVLILCFILYVSWFFSGEPIISVDYLALLNQRDQPQVRDEDNAWPHYEKAIALFVEPSQSIKKVVAFSGGWWTPTYGSFAELSEENKREIRKWVEHNEAAWQEFVAGSEKVYCYCQWKRKDQNQFLCDIILSPHGSLRSLAKLGIWRCRIAITNEEISNALTDCITVTRVGKHWQSRKGLIAGQRQGLDLSVWAMDEILFIVSAYDVSVSDLTKIQHQLEEIYGAGFPLLDIEQEKILLLSIVQQFYTQGGPGGGHIVPEKLRTTFFPDIEDFDFSGVMPWQLQYVVGNRWFKKMMFLYFCLRQAGRDETVAKYNEIFNKMSGLVEMTPYEKHAKNVEIDHIRMTPEISKQFYLLLGLGPPMFYTADWMHFGKSQYEALLTILALQRWRLDKDGYPDKLEELVKKNYLKQLPTDPYSDKPLIYKKNDNDFALYSVGENFRDDAGEVVRYSLNGEIAKWGLENGDAVFWPVPKTQVLK
jgi:hypothetical protein